MERGSLLYALRMDDEAEELSWSQRVNILSGTGNALSYMHHACRSNPKSRPSMQQVAHEFSNFKQSSMSLPFFEITLSSDHLTRSL
ncbi:hypothetical protein Ahy_A02g005411 isoform B [Arachis hypogaea]|uniref:non-specific serine/threonine protein kinase n=1 Tax=Arachis hypogaea TaxID=3818 RepID=A0A445E6R8_ARAHY|nr:hypothetical protein Ahy_A02g005411 isoform B [Arachis hypogaea]